MRTTTTTQAEEEDYYDDDTTAAPTTKRPRPSATPTTTSVTTTTLATTTAITSEPELPKKPNATLFQRQPPPRRVGTVRTTPSTDEVSDEVDNGELSSSTTSKPKENNRQRLRQNARSRPQADFDVEDIPVRANGRISVGSAIRQGPQQQQNQDDTGDIVEPVIRRASVNRRNRTFANL